jgi:hypothetical protein
LYYFIFIIITVLLGVDSNHKVAQPNIIALYCVKRDELQDRTINNASHEGFSSVLSRAT